MRKIILLSVAASLFVFSGCASSGMRLDEQKIVSFNTEVRSKIAAVILLKDNNPLKSETGFFVDYNNEKFFVTCAHMLYEALDEGHKLEELKVATSYQNNSIQLISYKITPREDLLDMWILKPKSSNKSIFAFKMLEQDKKRTIFSGMDIIFCGFPVACNVKEQPSFVYVTRRCIVSAFAPILRQGDPRNVYLIDAIVDPGDSGSPVVDMLNKKLIGFVKGYRKDPSQKKQELGLGIVIPINYVLDYIDSNDNTQGKR